LPRPRRRSARWRSGSHTGQPRWTRPSPSGGTSIGAPPLTVRPLAARTPLSVPRWRLSRPPATATEAPCSRETAAMATWRRCWPRSHGFPCRDGGAGVGG
jgi:hypothetical protein